MKLIPSIKTKTASIVAITALAAGLTPVLPAGANEPSEFLLAQVNQSDITGVIPRIIRFQARRAIRQNIRQGVQQGVQQYTDFFNNTQQLFNEIESCAASNCSELGDLLTEAAEVVEGLPEPPVLPQ
ncbi:MAG: hypothetical protein F6K26_20475 [Moorea sp. SIO2I5]|nr:hypothetical protein [Moorena sp. SIO2I5]